MEKKSEELYVEYPMITYRMSMQVLSDELDAVGILHFFYNRSENAENLEGVRFYKENEILEERYLYVVPEYSRTKNCQDMENICFLCMRHKRLEDFSFTSSIIELKDEQNLLEIYQLLQSVFEKYKEWDKKLQWAMQSYNPLQRLIEVSKGIFGNPIFVHDREFYILAYSQMGKDMPYWEKDKKSRFYMVSMELINEYKINKEYQQSLQTEKVTMFSPVIRDYRILYMNLWDQKRYEGRICVNEVERPFRKSDYFHLEHLAKLVAQCIKKRKLFWMTMGNDMDHFLSGVLDGKSYSEEQIDSYLRFLHWKKEGRYLCLKFFADYENADLMENAGIFGYIEAQIPNGHAFLYEQNIVVIVNLSFDDAAAVSDILSSLAYLMREGLYKIGVSSEVKFFHQIRDAYLQASAALDYGKKSDSMSWSFHFEDYALCYILDSAAQKIHSELLGSGKLRVLRDYDEKNHTELYHTLDVYLRQERNVVQTSKELFIHRSTFFYRLERILKLVEADLDNPTERLYLELSFELERKKARSLIHSE